MITETIILKKQNTNEYDQWVTCYTKDFGKLKTIAKSILKYNSIQALHLDVFNLVEFDLINGRGVPIITGAQLINSYTGIKNSFAKMAVAYFFAEVIDKMVFENDKDEKLWTFLTSFLQKLDGKDNNPATLLRQSQMELLHVLGYFPEVNFCKACSISLDDRTFGSFNHALGGVICRRCFLEGQGGILISKGDFEMLNVGSVQQSGPTFQRSILDGMFEYISGNKFYSLELLSMVK